MSAIGYASLPITPSMRGVQKIIRDQLERPMAKASKSVGDSMSKNLVAAAESAARGVERARKREKSAAEGVQAAEQKLLVERKKQQALAKGIESAEARLEKVRVDSAAGVERAEKKLADLRAGGKATVEQVKAAESELASVRADQSAKVLQAEQKLEQARSRGLEGTVRVEGAEKNVARAKDKAAEASERVIGATKRYDHALEASTKKLGLFRRAHEQMAAPMATLTSSMKGFVGIAAAGLGLSSITGAMGSMISQGRDLDKVMGSLSAVTGATSDQMAAVKEKARDLGKDTELAGTSAASAADAMLALAKGGMDVSQSMDAAKGSIQLAGAAQIDAGQAAEIQIAALNVFRLKADQASHVADVLTNAANNSATGLVDLGEAMKTGAPSAATLGISLEDTTAALGLMANNGYKGSIAGTQLKNALDNMINPTKKNQEAFDQLGLKLRDGEDHFVGMREVAEQLHEAQERMSKEDFSAAIAQGFGDQGKAMAAAAAVGGEAFDDLRGKMDRAGSAGETAGAALAGLNGAMDRINNALDDVKQRIYDAVAPTLTKGVDALAQGFGLIGDAMGKIGEFASRHQNAMMVVNGALAGWAASVTIMAGAGLVSWLRQAAAGFIEFSTAILANPLGLIAAAIGAVIAALTLFFTKTDTGKRMWGQLTEFMRAEWDKLQGFLLPAFDRLKSVFTATVDTLKAAWGELTAAFSGGDDGFGGLSALFGDRAGEMFANFAAIAGDAFRAVSDAVQQAWPVVLESLETVGSILSATVLPVLGMLWDQIKAVVPDLLEFGRAIGEVVVTAVQAAWGVISSFLGLVKDLWNFLSPVLLPVLKFLGEVVGVILVGAFDTAVIAITAAIKIFRTIVEAVTYAIDHALRPMIDWVGKVGQSFIEMKRTIVQAFSNAASWLYSAGRDIISGLVRGIRSMGSAVRDAILDHIPSSLRGAIQLNSVGSIAPALPFAAGGVERHVAQIAPAGAMRVWAEPETGGEAYIPLAAGKRARSTAILSTVANHFGLGLVKPDGTAINPTSLESLAPRTSFFADGGIVKVTKDQLLAFARGESVNGQRAKRSLEGAPYVFGGRNWGDCSGALSGLARFAVGLQAFVARFATMNEKEGLTELGFKPGMGGPGDFSIGWLNGGPGGGHTASTIGNVNAEMGGARGNGQIGGGAAGASRFPNIMHIALLDSKNGAPVVESTSTDGQTFSAGGGRQTAQVSWGSADALHKLALRGVGLYDNGGVLPHGALALNLSGKPETIRTHDETIAIRALLDPVRKIASAFTGDGGFQGFRTKEVVDAEKGLLETRQALAANARDLSVKEQAVSDLREKIAKLEADGGGMSVQSRRKIEDAENALASARAKGKPDQIAKAETRLARAREDAQAQVEKSGVKNAKDLSAAYKQLGKAQDELANARRMDEESAQRLAAAERTLQAARIKSLSAIGDAVSEIGQSIGKTMHAVMDLVGQIVQQAEKARAEIRHWQDEMISSAFGEVSAQQKLRRAQQRAREARAKAAMVGMDLSDPTRTAGTSLIDLGKEIDRFRETGVFTIGETTKNMRDQTGAVIEFTKLHIQKAALETARSVGGNVLDTGSLTSAQVMDLQARRMDAYAAEMDAQDEQINAVFALREANIKAKLAADLAAQSTAMLSQQAAQFYGMTSQGVSRAQRGFEGISEVTQGVGQSLGGAAAGAAAGFALAGPVGALAGGLLGTLLGAPKITTGSIKIHHNKKDIGEFWGRATGEQKAAIIAGNSMNVLGGAAAPVLGRIDPQLAQLATQGLGGSGQTFAALPFSDLAESNRVLASRYEESKQAREREADEQIRDLKAQLSDVMARRESERQSVMQGKVVLDLKKDLAAAVNESDAAKIKDLIIIQQRAYDDSVAAAREDAERLNAIRDNVDRIAKDRGVQRVVVNIPSGSAYSSDEVADMFNAVTSRVDGLEVEVHKQAEKGRGAAEFAAARRGY